MKKYAGYLVVAVLGGLISLGAFALIQKSGSSLKGVPQQSTPVQFTSMTGMPSTNPDFTAAANTSIHAVVHVKTEYARKNSMYDNFFNFHDFFGDSPYSQQGPLQGAGSGVIISPDGYIVTNNHVVQDASKIEIVLNDKRSYEGTIVGTDPSTDLAVVRIKETNLPFLNYGNSDELQIGEWVLAVGNPFNLTSTVTAGIVSAKARNINILGTPDNTSIESFIQTDAAVNRGNSGGALVNTRGELVGINAAIASGNGFYAGYSFAIPVNIVKKVVGDLIDFREVQRAFLGVSIREIDSKLAEEQGIKELRGVFVQEVNDGSAAKEAGIVRGDVITSVNKMTVNSTSELLEQVSRYRPGEKIVVGVSRKGTDKNFNVTLLNRAGTTGLVKTEAKDVMPMLGAKIQVASQDVLRKLGLDHGVQVTELSDGLLRNAGVREGYVITEIDKKPIRNLDDLNKILSSKSGGILLEGVYPNKVRAYYGFGIN
ncbi:MAG TPA: Do family serine endopeptidase [Bacteroidales bacterium]|nr:Do family serine endopeptidase [Bacteroidales bacterium]